MYVNAPKSTRSFSACQTIFLITHFLRSIHDFYDFSLCFFRSSAGPQEGHFCSDVFFFCILICQKMSFQSQNSAGAFFREIFNAFNTSLWDHLRRDDLKIRQKSTILQCVSAENLGWWHRKKNVVQIDSFSSPEVRGRAGPGRAGPGNLCFSTVYLTKRASRAITSAHA